ncbi:carboxy-S-adenosyl-L-methionine synthase CmoA [Arcticibacter sp.]|uniref:carboxy-S-adenosyl-L-methionine synthase CmoA n=1 Tax=Arcticibacter sp. TaxID=1872630 RepID=UPI00388ECCC3
MKTDIKNTNAEPPRDEVFRDQINRVSDFKFGTKVVSVFDDMVSRSVPFYDEMQRMISELAAEHALPETVVYDLGCSTGTTLIGMNETVSEDIKFVGIDDASEMLKKCDGKLKEAGFQRPYELIEANIQQDFEIKNASVVVLCLTLQFIRPICREKVLRKIVEGLVPGGVLILVEKILAEESSFNRSFIQYYYDYKRRNHYSEMEISQKREALENVLIPYKLSENILLLKEAGFSQCEVFFKWYNFSGIVAVKN